MMWHLRKSDREEREGYGGRDGRGLGGWTKEEEKDGERKVGGRQDAGRDEREEIGGNREREM